MGKTAVAIDLTAIERRELESLAPRRKTAQGLAQRARIVLLAATNGIWMRSSSRLLASRTGCGAPSIKMASFSTSWSSVEETVALRSSS